MNYDIEKLNEFFAEHPDDISIADIDMARIPRHISCIMDGNGRWATSRGLGRGEGHKAGIVALQDVITACVRMGVDVLSAYAFSTENWNRPQAEVDLLMYLFAKTFVDEPPLLNARTRVSFSFTPRSKKTATSLSAVLPDARLYGRRCPRCQLRWREITVPLGIAEAMRHIAVEQIDDALVADHPIRRVCPPRARHPHVG
ncbi:MAG: undecaprenyl diphosphate synthase family protein [Collinsella aerofaciens]